MSTADQPRGDSQLTSPAKLWLRSALVVFVVCVLMAIALLPSQPEEPVYQDRSLSKWITIYRESHGDSGQREQAKAAVRIIGTNSIPSLLKMIRASDSDLRIRAQVLANNLNLHNLDFLRAPEARSLADWGFHALGEGAKGAVPELLTLAKGATGTSGRREAIFSLGGIGPPARSAIPALMAIAADTNDLDRNYAIHSLATVRSFPEIVLPFLNRCLRDPDERVRWNTALAVSKFGEAAQPSVPSLIALLSDPSDSVRERAAKSLKLIDPAAAVAAGIK